MSKNLKKYIMVLSSGRTGTKYLYDFFRHQRILSYHEELYGNRDPHDYLENSIKISNNWHKNIAHSDSESIAIANDYIENLSNIMKGNRLYYNFYSGSPKGSPGRKLSYLKKYIKYPLSLSNKIVIDCNNSIAPMFESISALCKKLEIDNYFIVLMRNPIKTIHAIYTTENKSNFPMRPLEFKENKDGYIAAAYIWKNTYNMFLQKLENFSSNEYLLLNIEAFNKDYSLIHPLFNFLGANLNEDNERKRKKQLFLNKKFRSFKDHNDIINSDLYVDRSFYFTKEEVDKILAIIEDTAKKMKINLNECADEYFEFHRNKKNNIGFREKKSVSKK